MAEKDPRKIVYLRNTDIDGLWLAGVGEKGDVSVLIDRHASGIRVLLLTSDGDRSAEVRYCPVDRSFGTEKIQEVFHLLDAAAPSVITATESNVHTVTHSLANHNPQPKKTKP